MIKLNVIIIDILLVIGFNAKIGFAQSTVADSIRKDSLPANDSFLKSLDYSKSKPFPYPQPDVSSFRLYAQIWREIDLADSANSNLAIPGKSLMETIMNGIKLGKLTVFEKDDFQKKLTAKQGVLRFADSVLIPIFDKDGNQIGSRMALNDFNPEKITRFRIKEDVYFDRQRGRIETRILGLAPMMPINTTADLSGLPATIPAFWLYFPQLRYQLVTTDIGNVGEDINSITLDDIFMQRRFTARLVKKATPGGVQSGLLEAGSPEALKFEQKLTALKGNVWKSPRGIDINKLEKESDRKAVISRKEIKHEKAIKNR